MDVYGITNCDTVKKARKFLNDAGIEYTFHDYKKEGADVEKLSEFVAEFGWENVLNRRGTTWRKLDEDLKESVVDGASAIAIMVENPSVIKRPIVQGEGRNFIGFDPVAWEMALELGELK